jgi:quinoprotein glucose dehydrogenase
MFTPPSLGAGSIAYPATPGGVEWGGGAVDPTTGTYVVNSSSVAQIYRLLDRKDYKAASAGGAKHYYPQEGAPYGLYLDNFSNWLGMPCWKPPYGLMSEYDLATGRLIWRKTFGVVQKWGFYMPKSWGSPTIGGPMITRTGLIFIGASMDSHVRAVDERTGKVLWSAQVDAPAVAIPATYTYRGKQYVVFTVGGNTILSPRVGDQLVAFALP